MSAQFYVTELLHQPMVQIKCGLIPFFCLILDLTSVV